MNSILNAELTLRVINAIPSGFKYVVLQALCVFLTMFKTSPPA